MEEKIKPGEERPEEEAPLETAAPAEAPDASAAPVEESSAAEEEKTSPEEEKSSGADHKVRRGELKKLKKELEETKKKLAEETKRADEAEDKVLRLAAEYDNFRKRTQSEKSGIYADAVSDTLSGLLPIIDNLQYAAKYSGGDAEKVAEGLTMILSKLPETLEKLGIKAFGEAGETFDPALHNAVMHVEDEEHGEGEIVEVLQQGYMYGDKVLRYAMVKTAN